MLSTEFLLTSLAVILIPGTGVIYTISTGLSRRWRASIAAAVGCTAGIIPHVTACILGLSAILNMSAQAFRIIRMAGSLYLLFLAWSMWRSTESLSFEKDRPAAGMFRIMAKGFLINILNPKLTMFFLAFLPLFISPEAGPAGRQMLVLSSVFMLMTLIIFVLYGVLSSSISSFFIKSGKSAVRLQRSFAVIFAFLALKFALIEKK